MSYEGFVTVDCQQLRQRPILKPGLEIPANYAELFLKKLTKCLILLAI